MGDYSTELRRLGELLDSNGLNCTFYAEDYAVPEGYAVKLDTGEHSTNERISVYGKPHQAPTGQPLSFPFVGLSYTINQVDGHVIPNDYTMLEIDFEKREIKLDVSGLLESDETDSVNRVQRRVESVARDLSYKLEILTGNFVKI